MPSTFTPNLNLELQATGEDSGTWGTNLNNSVFSIIDSVLGGSLGLPMSGSDITLNTAQSQTNFIDITGILTTNVNVIFPNIGRTYIVRNRTTGSFTVTLKTTAAGAVVVVPQGTIASVVLSGGDVLSGQLGFTPVQQGGGSGQSSTTKVNIGWAPSFNQLFLQTGAMNWGGVWPININGSAQSVNGVSSPATAGSTCQYATDIVEFGYVQVWSNGHSLPIIQLDLPSPYVVTGLRTDSNNRVYLRARALMSQ